MPIPTRGDRCRSERPVLRDPFARSPVDRTFGPRGHPPDLDEPLADPDRAPRGEYLVESSSFRAHPESEAHDPEERPRVARARRAVVVNRASVSAERAGREAIRPHHGCFEPSDRRDASVRFKRPPSKRPPRKSRGGSGEPPSGVNRPRMARREAHREVARGELDDAARDPVSTDAFTSSGRFLREPRAAGSPISRLTRSRSGAAGSPRLHDDETATPGARNRRGSHAGNRAAILADAHEDLFSGAEHAGLRDELGRLTPPAGSDGARPSGQAGAPV